MFPNCFNQHQDHLLDQLSLGNRGYSSGFTCKMEIVLIHLIISYKNGSQVENIKSHIWVTEAIVCVAIHAIMRCNEPGLKQGSKRMPIRVKMTAICRTSKAEPSFLIPTSSALINSSVAQKAVGVELIIFTYMVNIDKLVKHGNMYSLFFLAIYRRPLERCCLVSMWFDILHQCHTIHGLIHLPWR